MRTALSTVKVGATRPLRGAVLAILVSNVLACSIDQHGFGAAIDPAKLLQSVEVEYRSYNVSRVAPYDTVTLNVRGVSGTGSTIEAPVVYGYDPRYVTVSPAGFLQALAPVTKTPVTVTMTLGGSTRVDTILVSVLKDAPQQLRRLAIELNAGDSAKTAVTSAKALRLIREGSNGTNMSTVLVTLRSSDTATAKIAQSGNNANVTPVRPGRVMLYVSTYAYGTGIRDSLSLLVGWPLSGWVGSYASYQSGGGSPQLHFKSSNFTVGVGACVMWFNANDVLDLDVVFDDSPNVAPANSAFVSMCRIYGSGETASDGTFPRGNIAPWRRKDGPNGVDVLSQIRARSFPRAGVYRFHSTQSGSSGAITVCDEKNDPTCSPENYQWGVINP